VGSEIKIISPNFNITSFDFGISSLITSSCIIVGFIFFFFTFLFKVFSKSPPFEGSLYIPPSLMPPISITDGLCFICFIVPSFLGS
jgi:hypothetical protein